MNSQKLVTIVLPAYNEEKSFPLIRQCMNQVLIENTDYDWDFYLLMMAAKTILCSK